MRPFVARHCIVLSLIFPAIAAVAAPCTLFIPNNITQPTYTVQQFWSNFDTLGKPVAGNTTSYSQPVRNPLDLAIMSGLPVPGVFQECNGAFPTVASTAVDGDSASHVEPPTAANSFHTSWWTAQAANGVLTVTRQSTAIQGGGLAYADNQPQTLTYTIKTGAISLQDGGGTSIVNGDLSRSVAARSGSFSGVWPVTISTANPLADLNLTPGWNMRGVSSTAPFTVANTFSDATKVNTVWKWIESTSRWAFYTPLLADGGVAYAASHTYDFLTTINSGEGYWVNAK